jgi:transcriptional regulator with PAS, ATPase and Fis domain
MAESDTKPRIVLRQPVDATDKVGVLILAGYAFGELPRGLSRIHPASPELLLGREHASCLTRYGLDDPFLSRRHARIARAHNGAYFLSDLGSKNGTWLDGARIPPRNPRKLRDGAVVMMGGHVYVFRRATTDELDAIREDASQPFGLTPTSSPRMALLMSKLRRLAPAGVDLLLTGETGVGKEVHAEAIHRAHGCRGPFAAINCAAIPDNLVESELFGYARGAHSTADRAKAGLIEQASGGTLFLDEIGEMPQAAQTKLLRFLQSREVQSLGAVRSRVVDVRVIAATHRGLAGDGRTGLRYDLAARLGPEPLVVPPLRERVEDIGLLARQVGDGDLSMDPEAFLALFLYDWKGNVRELGKVLTVARVLAKDRQTIDCNDLPLEIVARVAGQGRPLRRNRPAREELMGLLTTHKGDVARVAREIGRQRTLVWRWLRQDSLRVDDFRR